jgi:glycosyltransferase involved in cell wall biosynthesis
MLKHSCVVTDVGDSSYVVGETGRVVPPKNPIALANAWEELLAFGEEERRILGHAARERVREHFNVETIAKRYEALYRGPLP